MKGKMILLLIATLFIGMCINIPKEEDKSQITQDKLESFESEIIIQGNNYQSDVKNIETGIVNETGKKVEGIIDQGFAFCFNIIKGMID